MTGARSFSSVSGPAIIEERTFEVTLVDELRRGKRVKLNLDPQSSVNDVYEEAGKILHYKPGFELYYIDGKADEILLKSTMSTIGNIPTINGIRMLYVREGDTAVESTVVTSDAEAEQELKEITSATTDMGLSDEETPSKKRATGSNLAITAVPTSYRSWNTKSDTGFIGLTNQGATCYLNSLLQTLYMTPEFRNAIYHWKATKKRSIPMELQRLFVQLQTADDKAVETTDITKSFGWDRSDSFQQQDVQELIRVLFDALEKEWAGTDQANLIDELYAGTFSDYIKCKECGYESSREDKYLDIALVLKEFGATEVVGSVEEALSNFVKVEELNGDNQYQCSGCEKKVDALKGLEITKFPQILTLQLKRFDYDYQLDRRVKLHERVTFPEKLDLLPFYRTGHSQNGPDPSTGEDEGESPSSLEYELYSIMIHSGSALGGHYYAYIKNFDDGKWYCFNDSSVSEISAGDIEKAFGGTSSSSSYRYQSTMSGYMLMYRRIDPEHTAVFLKDDELPEHVLEAKRQKDAEEEESRKQDELRRAQCNISVYWQPNPESDDKPEKKEILFQKTTPFKDVLKRSLEEWKLVPTETEKYRLRKYEFYNENMTMPFDPEEEATLSDKNYVYGSQCLIIEKSNHDGTFADYNADDPDVRIKLIVWNNETKEFGPTRRVALPKSKTYSLHDIRECIAELIGCDEPQKVRVLKATGQAFSEFKNTYPLIFASCPRIYADTGGVVKKEATDGDDDDTQDDDDDVHEEDVTKSEFAQAVGVNENTVTFYTILPGEGDDCKDHPVRVDKRMQLSEFKEKYLIPLVKLDSTQFQIWKSRSYTNAPLTLMECSDLTRKLDEHIYSEPYRIWVKEGRAAKPGEVLTNVMLIDIADEKYEEEFLDVHIKPEASVEDYKEAIIQYANEKAQTDEQWEYKDLKLSKDRMRIRVVQYTQPSEMVVSEIDARISYDRKFCLQILDAPEPKTNIEQLLLFVRVWHRDTYTLGPLLEICTPEEPTQKDVLEQLSKLTEIPIESMEVIVTDSDYPFTPSLLKIEDEDWSNEISRRNQRDGGCVFVRDSAVTLKELTAEEKAKIKKEESRKNKRYYVPRKEKALKIYTTEEQEQKEESKQTSPNIITHSV